MGWPYPRGRTVLVVNFTTNPRTQERALDPDRTYLVDRCAFDPGTSSEGNVPGVQTTTEPRFFGPYDLDIDPLAIVAVDDVDLDWEVHGEVARWRNDLTGTEACSEIRLQRKRGAL